MRAQGGNNMGQFSVEFEVANNDDMAEVRRGQRSPDQVRRATISGKVDGGAVRLVLPKAVVKQLGLTITGKVKVRYADGRRATRATVEGVYVDIQGRHNIFLAIVEPKRETALIGAVVLEDLDYVVDCTNRRLVPRDPAEQFYEIE